MGTKLPGLRGAVELAIEAHRDALRELPWLRMVGWDLMLTDNGPVFFEGNFAQMRLPRRVFLTWDTLLACARGWYPYHAGWKL